MKAKLKRELDAHVEGIRRAKEGMDKEDADFAPMVVTFDEKGPRLIDTIIDFRPETKTKCFIESMGLVRFDPKVEMVVVTTDAFWREYSEEEFDEDNYIPPSQDPQASEGLVSVVWFKNSAGDWETLHLRDTYHYEPEAGLVWDSRFQDRLEELERASEQPATVETWFLDAFEVVQAGDAPTDVTLREAIDYLVSSDAHMVGALRQDVVEEVAG